MSSIWTPDGERPVEPQQPQQSSPDAPEGAQGPGQEREPNAAQLDELRRQLAETPASIVVANHAFGLFELAALHLSLQPPKLSEAQLAIDALGAITESLAGRLGEQEPQIREGLAQLRVAFVQISQAAAQPKAN